MKDGEKKSYADFFRGSLKGHIVAIQIFCAVPYFLIFLILDYFDGTVLSFSSVLRLIGSSVLFGLIAAILTWYAVVKPLKKKYKI